MGIVHPPYGKSMLPWLPLSGFDNPNKLGGEVWVEEMTHIRILSIGLEVAHECCVMLSCIVNDILHAVSSILIPCEKLLARKMELEADNIGNLLMQVEVEDPPLSLMS